MPEIRAETALDAAAIHQITQAAFAGKPYSAGTEGAIIDALRESGRLTLSLVADEAGQIVGHVAFSPVVIGGQDTGWLALGPVAVRPDQQGRGIGATLIRAGLAHLRERDAKGCLVVGDPGYYHRFGFAADPAVHYPGAPPQYLLRLAMSDAVPRGQVTFDPAFDAS